MYGKIVIFVILHISCQSKEANCDDVISIDIVNLEKESINDWLKVY